MEFREKAFANKVAVTCHTIICSLLFAAYLLEVVKGSRSIGYFAVIALFCVVPVAAEWVLYKKDPENTITRHIMGTTYGIMYVFAVFTTNSLLTFTYVFPMLIAITIYSDVIYGAIIAVTSVLCNVIYVVYHFSTTGYAKSEITDVEIRVLVLAVIGIFLYLTMSASKRIGVERMKEINANHEKMEKMMTDVFEASDGMTGDIETITDRMNVLGESVTHISNAMQEVSSGSNETVDSIQTQMNQTEKIQSHIADVKESAKIIETNMTETVDVVVEGKKQMNLLADNAEESLNASNQVNSKMSELNEYTQKMNSIIEAITSIAGSTGMLALNASIEAARAGEAGRGFAVVAEQISQLANQTKNATVDITNLIDGINQELVNVSKAVDMVTDNIENNVESTKMVAKNFA